jgi:hypothetical protein
MQEQDSTARAAAQRALDALLARAENEANDPEVWEPMVVFAEIIQREGVGVVLDAFAKAGGRMVIAEVA